MANIFSTEYEQEIEKTIVVKVPMKKITLELTIIEAQALQTLLSITDGSVKSLNVIYSDLYDTLYDIDIKAYDLDECFDVDHLRCLDLHK